MRAVHVEGALPLGATKPESEPAEAREVLFRCRDDLIVSPQGPLVIVKDPITNTFMRLGRPEFAVAKYFDGKSTITEIARRLKATGAIVTEEKLIGFRDRLHGLKLILADGETVEQREADLGMSTGLLSKLILIPIPLKLNPDQFLTQIHRYLWFLFTPAYPIATIVGFLIALQIWLEQWSVIVAQGAGLASAKSVIISWFVWTVSVSLHEIAHGLTTKAFGGRVHRMGLFVYYLNLAFYTDVSDAWLFEKKLHRFLVIAAGAHTTFVLCFIGTIGWRISIPGTALNDIFYIFMIFNAFAASFTLTPFLRGDGYHMLSSFLDIPNLREKAFAYARARLNAIFSRGAPPPPRANPREARIFILYALSTFLFSVLFISWVGYSFLSWFLGRFEAWGLFALAVVILMQAQDQLGHIFEHSRKKFENIRLALARLNGHLLLRPVTIVWDYLGRGWDYVRRVPRWLIVLFLIAGVGLIPYDITVSGPFEVITLDPPEVRTLTGGVLDSVLVHSGARVERGDIVAVLLERDLMLESAKLSAELAEAEAKLALTTKWFRPEEIESARLKVEELSAAATFAQATLKREQELHAKGFSPRERVEEAQSQAQLRKKLHEQAGQELRLKQLGARPEQIEQVRAEVANLKARADQLQQHLAWTRVIAHLGGTVVTPEQDMQRLIGSDLRRGDVVMKIVDESRLVARIQVPEHEFGDIAVGQEIILRSYQSPQKTYKTIVDQVEPTVERRNELSTTVSVIGRLSDVNGELRLGTTGMAKVVCENRSIAYVTYRRLLRSLWVRFWSWW